MKRWLLVLSALLVCSCFPVKDDAPPFNIGDAWGVLSREPIKPHETFFFSVSVSAVRPVDDVKVNIALPKEVKASKVELVTLVEGKTIAREEGKGATAGAVEWSGDVTPDRDKTGQWSERQQSVNLSLTSEVDGTKWSSPIEASVGQGRGQALKA
jgi:hypothetical protein